MGESSVSAALSAEVQHACPRCRSAIELTDGGGVCSACGFKVTLTKGIYCFLGQAETVNEWQNTYEDLASGPLGNTSTADEYRSPIQHRYIIAAFRRVCGAIPPNARILDVGCGNGIFWESLLGGPRAIGIDYSLSMCVLARARKLLAYQANALALPFADEQFDLIYSAEMLQLIDDLPALFAELARVCRPGGRIVVSTLNAGREEIKCTSSRVGESAGHQANRRGNLHSHPQAAARTGYCMLDPFPISMDAMSSFDAQHACMGSLKRGC
jgi:SAM-dependent methyltransferase